MIPSVEAFSYLPDDVKRGEPWCNLTTVPLDNNMLSPLSPLSPLNLLHINQPIHHNDTLKGDSILQMEVNRLSQQVELLQEQVAHLQEQQFVLLDGKRGTLEQLADEVAERLKERANLW